MQDAAYSSPLAATASVTRLWQRPNFQNLFLRSGLELFAVSARQRFDISDVALDALLDGIEHAVNLLKTAYEIESIRPRCKDIRSIFRRKFAWIDLIRSNLFIECAGVMFRLDAQLAL